MNVVEPIRDQKKILAIKRNLKEENKPRNYLLFVAGINLALRISDLLSLRVKDILDKQGNIKEFIHLKEKKTKRQVKIKLNKTVKEALNYFLDKARVTDPEQYLFKSERGNRALDRIRAWGLIQKWTIKRLAWNPNDTELIPSERPRAIRPGNRGSVSKR